MKQFKTYNCILGWVVWIIAVIVYIMTIEPTTSFWDCGEFIATAYKLEVGHPPGAPFFMILARFFSLFAGNPSNVAMTINILSALASAFTILFLFWTITHLARKIILKSEELTAGNLVGILGSGFIGAMVFTFSDTFWFSAVEGEVYASSSLFTAVVFWAIIKWENVADEKYANRWLVFIAYMMGLSVGIHLLNLLAIPAIVFVYYFRKYEVTRKGIVLASLISVTLLGIIMYGIIPGAVTMASVFELVFVNGLSMSYNIGVLIYIILLISGLVAGLYFTSRSGRKTTLNTVLFAGTLILLGVPLFFDGFLVVLSIAGVVVLSYFLAKHSEALVNTVLLCCTVILIGYSSFSMIVIRSLANPPMDENNPEDVFSLLAYLNREQYGDRPLFYGQYFNAPVDNRTPYKEGSPTYIRKNGEYVIATRKQIYNYLPEYCSVFPRMYSSQRQHVDDYIYWTGTKHSDFYEVLRDEEGNVRRDREGKILYDYSEPKKRPSMMNNLKFFFRYQVGFMYLRYFMWNFSGRQNDIQGHGNILHGNWLSGLKLIDDPRVGPQDTLPGDLANNKGKNIYFMFPLILGLIGLFFHWQSHRNDFLVVMLLFFMTGIAVVVYLNQYPHQPRERDYAYAGSFYAFAIWIGLGVMALYRMAKKISFKNYVIYGAGGFFALGLIGYVLGSKGFGGGMTYISIMMAALSIIVMF
ncbi:MAG: DUF2723 domain-containing protein, partial [Bacteroidetes bacterium]|nr:DUF2723 domain-containing protein [Bacteroidota bacterium]